MLSKEQSVASSSGQKPNPFPCHCRGKLLPRGKKERLRPGKDVRTEARERAPDRLRTSACIGVKPVLVVASCRSQHRLRKEMQKTPLKMPQRPVSAVLEAQHFCISFRNNFSF